MTKILMSLLIAAVMSCSAVLARDISERKDAQKRVEFFMQGKFDCVLVDGKVICAREAKRAPVKLGPSVSN